MNGCCGVNTCPLNKNGFCALSDLENVLGSYYCRIRDEEDDALAALPDGGRNEDN